MKKNTCTGCGEQPNASRCDECPAWGTICDYCKKPNHDSKVCYKKKNKQYKTQTVNSLQEVPSALPHESCLTAEILKQQDETCRPKMNNVCVTESSSAYLYVSQDPDSNDSTKNAPHVIADITPIVNGKPMPTKYNVQLFPDTGASLNLAGPFHQANTRFV